MRESRKNWTRDGCECGYCFKRQHKGCWANNNNNSNNHHDHHSVLTSWFNFTLGSLFQHSLVLSRVLGKLYILGVESVMEKGLPWQPQLAKIQCTLGVDPYHPIFYVSMIYCKPSFLRHHPVQQSWLHVLMHRQYPHLFQHCTCTI